MQDADERLIDRWKDVPLPLLPLLHAFHDRDGYLSETALRRVSEALRIPLAELYGTVTFYHHFARDLPGRKAPRVCLGPICVLRGAHDVLTSLAEEGATAMACSGRCDEPVPILTGDRVEVQDASGRRPRRASLMPAPPPAGTSECVFRSIRVPDRATLDGYRASGGYAGLERALGMTPAEIRRVVTESGLAGRGGAGFPTGAKWEAVAGADGHPKYVVLNADEGEPGCFKDRALMDHDPFAVVEGMTIAALATGATEGYVYLRYEYPETLGILTRAIEAARAAGWLGADIGGRGLRFDIHVRRGAGAYVCGEEGSLLNSLEGKHPFPRNRPPYPVTHGLLGRPTVVNNVETLASVPPILTHGAAWYADLGLDGHKGTKVISLSGDVERPGNYEVPIGLPLQTLLQEWAGGPHPGRRFQAVSMAGLSGGFLAGADLDVTLDEPSIRARGSFLGAGGIMVFDDSRDMVEVTRGAMAFFADESCGKCFPCRIGTTRLAERLTPGRGPDDVTRWLEEVEDIGAAMKATSACGLGTAAPLLTESLVRYFPERVARHVARQEPVS